MWDVLDKRGQTSQLPGLKGSAADGSEPELTAGLQTDQVGF